MGPKETPSSFRDIYVDSVTKQQYYNKNDTNDNMKNMRYSLLSAA